MQSARADEDEIEVEDLTIELPSDYDTIGREKAAEDLIRELPELLRAHLAQLGQD
jgi:hypothetical protein